MNKNEVSDLRALVDSLKVRLIELERAEAAYKCTSREFEFFLHKLQYKSTEVAGES